MVMRLDSSHFVPPLVKISFSYIITRFVGYVKCLAGVVRTWVCVGRGVCKENADGRVRELGAL